MQRRTLRALVGGSLLSFVAALSLAPPADATTVTGSGCSITVTRSVTISIQYKDKMTIDSDSCGNSTVVRLWVQGRTCAPISGVCANTYYGTGWIHGTGAWASITLDVTEVWNGDHFDLSRDGGKSWVNGGF